MSLKKFKNYDQIKNNIGQIEGKYFSDDDLNLVWQGEYDNESYNKSNSDTVELSVYDMDENLLHWEVVSQPYLSFDQYNPNKLILKPGNDLRRNNFIRGQYRIVYEFYRNVVGSFNGGKAFVEEISPSRQEIRIRPVKIKGADGNLLFSRFVDFSDNGVPKNRYLTYFKKMIDDISTVDEIMPFSRKFGEVRSVFQKNIRAIKSQTKLEIEKSLDSFDMDYISTNEQSNIASLIVEPVFSNIFENKYIIDNQLSIIFQHWKNFISSITISDDESGNLDYFINFGRGKSYPIINWVRDNIKYPNSPYSIVAKLYSPLPNDIKEKSQLWISKLITNPIIDTVFILGDKKSLDVPLYSLTPNFDIKLAGLSGRSTGYESFNTLVSTYASTSQDILNMYFSSSKDGDIDLNIDWTDYYNFIHFGSAEERVRNFYYKLEQIDLYEENIKKYRTNYSSSGGTYGSASIGLFDDKIQQVKNSFDAYEKHLYYSSGSYYSGSLLDGSEHFVNEIHEWPKKNKKYPYVLYELTSSQSTNWYNDQLTIAQRFDRDNIYNFANNIPVYLKMDSDNEDYLNFLYMVGQHFDTLYTYINHLTKISNRDESIFNGLAKDLTFHIVKSTGFDLYSGNDNADLWRWSFGYSETGSYHTQTVSGSGEDRLSYGDVSKEIWRRILNNLPFLMKTKGTERSVRALLSCYGIPTSILAVREYGGPDPRDYEDLNRKSAYIFEDFVYSLDFEGSQSVSFTWENISGSHVPYSTEVRFAAAPTTKPTQSIFGTNLWGVTLHNNQDGTGYLTIQAGTSKARTEDYRYFDDEFNSILVRYSGSGFGHVQLFTKKAEGDKIIWYSSASIVGNINFISTATFYIGGNPSYTFGEQFTGSMQEFKCYYTSLSESTWNNHVRWPKSYNANSPEETYYDLILRYSFDDPKNHGIDTVVSDVKANQKFTTPGTANNFDSVINYTPRTEEFATLTPQAGGQRYINNKIRIESNEISYGDLSVDHRVEKSAFDREPLDSARLGVYFSPIDSINKDIIATYAGIDLAGEMGDPRDRYENHYRDLKELNDFYWNKYTSRPNYNDFIRVIKSYDQSFFDHLKSLLPARSKPIIGVLVEPHILERSKYKWNKVEKTRDDYDATINHQPTQSWEYNLYETALNIMVSSASSEYLTYTAELSTGFNEPSIYYTDEQQYISMIEPIQDTDQYTLINRIYNKISSSFDSNIGTTYHRLQYYTSSNGNKIFSKYCDIYELKPGSWYLEQWELNNSWKYRGTMNTINTTIDNDEPVKITFTNPNILKSTDVGPSKIKVE